MKIEILSFAGCPNHEPADRAVREVLAELGADAEIVQIDVPDEATAVKVRFLGSPTIRVDGEDIAPPASTNDFAMRCRFYQTANGLAGVPDKDVIRAAIQRSLP